MCKYRDWVIFIFPSMLGVKGIDHAHGDVVVMGDDEIDDAEFVPAHKCKFCSHYQAPEKYGICKAVLKLSIGRLPRMELAIARHSKWQQRPLRLKPYNPSLRKAPGFSGTMICLGHL